MHIFCKTLCCLREQIVDCYRSNITNLTDRSQM